MALVVNLPRSYQISEIIYAFSRSNFGNRLHKNNRTSESTIERIIEYFQRIGSVEKK